MKVEITDRVRETLLEVLGSQEALKDLLRAISIVERLSEELVTKGDNELSVETLERASVILAAAAMLAGDLANRAVERPGMH